MVPEASSASRATHNTAQVHSDFSCDETETVTPRCTAAITASSCRGFPETGGRLTERVVPLTSIPSAPRTGLNVFSSFKGTEHSERLRNTFTEVQTVRCPFFLHV